MQIFSKLIQRREPRNMIRTLFLGRLDHDRLRKAGGIPAPVDRRWRRYPRRCRPAERRMQRLPMRWPAPAFTGRTTRRRSMAYCSVRVLAGGGACHRCQACAARAAGEGIRRGRPVACDLLRGSAPRGGLSVGHEIWLSCLHGRRLLLRSAGCLSDAGFETPPSRRAQLQSREQQCQNP